MGRICYAVLNAHGELESVHDSEDAAIGAAHEAGAERVFDRAGQLISGDEQPEPVEPAPPPLPALRPLRPRRDDIARLLALLPVMGGDFSDEAREETQALIEQLQARGCEVGLLRRFRWDGYGGFAVWGWRVSRLRVGGRTVAAWSEHFTAEAPPPQCESLTWYFSDGAEVGGLDTGVLEELLADAGDDTGGPEELEEAIRVARRQARRRRKKSRERADLP